MNWSAFAFGASIVILIEFIRIRRRLHFLEALLIALVIEGEREGGLSISKLVERVCKSS